MKQPIQALAVALIASCAQAQTPDTLRADMETANQRSVAAVNAANYDEALAASEQAYALARQLGNDALEDQAVLAHNYAALLRQVGQIEKAAGAFGAALETHERAFGPKNPALIPLLMDIASLLTGDVRAQTIDRAMLIQRTANDPLARAALATRAGALLASERPLRPRAIELLEPALDTLEGTHGSKAPELIDTLVALGDAHFRPDEKGSDGRAFYKRALSIQKKQRDPLALADLRLQVGIRTGEQSRPSRALSYSGKAYDTYVEQLGPTDVKSGEAAMHCALFNTTLQRIDKAAWYFDAAQAAFAGKPSHIRQYQSALTGLVIAYENQGKRSAATPFVRKLGQLQASIGNQEVIPIVRRAPVYPARARGEKSEGLVKIRFTIDEAGFATNLDAFEVQGSPEFGDAALTAISQWRFAPRYVDGQPKRREAEQVIEFRLN